MNNVKIDESLLNLDLDEVVQIQNFDKIEVEDVKEKEIIADTYFKYVKDYLHTGYQTFTQILMMFIGYLITGFKYFGFDVWKDKTTIIFYVTLAVIAIILFLLEIKRDKMKGE